MSGRRSTSAGGAVADETWVDSRLRLGALLLEAALRGERDARVVLVEEREEALGSDRIGVGETDLVERRADPATAVLLAHADSQVCDARLRREQAEVAVDAADHPAVVLGDPRLSPRALGHCAHAMEKGGDVDQSGRRYLARQRDQVGSVALDVDLADTRHVLAAILTIGNEVVSGDTENTNASWLARRLEELGVKVVLSAAIPDELDRIVGFVRREAPLVDHLIVTGGLGGTPDDITREALAASFGVPQEEVPELAADLRARFSHNPDYAGRWAALPRGARPLENPLGGAPGFHLENAWVLPGLPSEMRAMFDRYADELRAERPIGSWRRRYRTRESTITPALREATERWPAVLVGSYPSFDEAGSEVEVVLKSSDPDLLAEARAWLEGELDRLT